MSSRAPGWVAHALGGILTLGREYRGSRCPRHAGSLAGGNGGDKEEVKHTRVTGSSPSRHQKI